MQDGFYKKCVKWCYILADSKNSILISLLLVDRKNTL